MFSFQIEGVKHSAFVPLAGMFNHKKVAMTAWGYKEKTKEFVYTALSDIPRGAALFTNYGYKDNMSYLLHYGFVVPENEFDFVRLKFDLNDRIPMYRIKKELMEGVITQWFDCPTNLDTEEMKDLLSWCRFLTYAGNPQHLKDLKGKRRATEEFYARNFRFYSRENEHRAW